MNKSIDFDENFDTDADTDTDPDYGTVSEKGKIAGAKKKSHRWNCIP
jgi:hypothetical protein